MHEVVMSHLFSPGSGLHMGQMGGDSSADSCGAAATEPSRVMEKKSAWIESFMLAAGSCWYDKLVL